MRIALILVAALGLWAADDPGLPSTLDAARQRLQTTLDEFVDGHESDALDKIINSDWYITANKAKDLELFVRYLGEEGEIRKIYGHPSSVRYIGTSYLTDQDAIVAYGVNYDNGMLPVVFGFFKSSAGYKLNLIKFGQAAAVELLPFVKVEGN
jgi:hypothetical protein